MQPISQPWSIILVKFKSSKSTPQEVNGVLSQLHDLFIDNSPSNFNIIKYFRDMSHGLIDMSNSEILGPFSLSGDIMDYNKGFFEGTAANEVSQEAKKIVVNSGKKLFERVLVCLMENGDIYGHPQNVFIGAGALIPPEICHEIGHGYGLNHSRIDISSVQDDYMDPMDIMSVRAVFSAEHSKYKFIGPGLNAANMKYLNWLDENRIFKTNERSAGQVQIRPLHSRHLNGYLGIECCDHYIEYRASKDWDAGFQSCVIMHKLIDGHSYLVPTRDVLENELPDIKNFTYVRSKVCQLTEAKTITIKYTNLLFYEITLLDIDSINQIATLSIKPINLTPGRIPRRDPGDMYGGIGVDGGGIIIRNGRIIRIPPRSPVMTIFKWMHSLTFAIIGIASRIVKSLTIKQKQTKF